jgi:hypothetical protein
VRLWCEHAVTIFAPPLSQEEMTRYAIVHWLGDLPSVNVIRRTRRFWLPDFLTI